MREAYQRSSLRRPSDARCGQFGAAARRCKAVGAICTACKSECDKFPNVAECTACAAACQTCADECRKASA